MDLPHHHSERFLLTHISLYRLTESLFPASINNISVADPVEEALLANPNQKDSNDAITFGVFRSELIEETPEFRSNDVRFIRGIIARRGELAWPHIDEEDFRIDQAPGAHWSAYYYFCYKNQRTLAIESSRLTRSPVKALEQIDQLFNVCLKKSWIYS
jgi:hypothetical protein